MNIFKNIDIVRKRVPTLAGQTVSCGKIIKEVQKQVSIIFRLLL